MSKCPLWKRLCVVPEQRPNTKPLLMLEHGWKIRPIVHTMPPLKLTSNFAQWPVMVLQWKIALQSGNDTNPKLHNAASNKYSSFMGTVKLEQSDSSSTRVIFRPTRCLYCWKSYQLGTVQSKSQLVLNSVVQIESSSIVSWKANSMATQSAFVFAFKASHLTLLDFE